MNTNKTRTNAVTAAIATIATITVAAGMFIASACIAATPAPFSTATSAPAKTNAVAANVKSGALDNATISNWKRLTKTTSAMVA